MSAATSEELLALYDDAPLNARYWVTFAIMCGVFVLDFFDFFLIAFVMSQIGPEWALTYGQGALILYGAGVGAIAGAIIWGALGDHFGRKVQTATGTIICAIAAGCIGLLPTGAWITLAILRFLVGFGLAAGVTPALTLVVERTPTRWRTGMTSFYVVFASAGTLLASFTSAILLHQFGWRGVALTGFAALIVGVLVWAFVPESVRWLAAKGRFAQARDEAARQLGVPRDQVPLPTVVPVTQPRGSLAELYHKPGLFWQTVLIWGGSASAAYGYYLWGPTIVAMALKVSPAKAASYFIYVAGCAVIGKLIASAIAPMMGPAHTGHRVRVHRRHLPRAGRLFQRLTARRRPAVHRADGSSGILRRGRLLQPGALHCGAIRRAAGLAFLRTRPGGERCRQDRRPSRASPACRQQQHHRAAGHIRCGVPGLHPARRPDAAGRAGLPVPRCRDTWPSYRAGARGAGVTTRVKGKIHPHSVHHLDHLAHAWIHLAPPASPTEHAVVPNASLQVLLLQIDRDPAA